MNGHKSNIICVYNSKGGCGKTCTSINVSGILASDYKKKVLIIDADTSANASTAIGRSEDPVVDFATLLIDYASDHTSIGELSDAICKTNVENIDIIPCINKTIYVRASKIIGADSEDGGFYFKDFIEQIEDDYDFIIIDVGAGQNDINPLATNALNCADFVLIPFFADAFDISGLDDVIKASTKRRSNPDLRVLGVFINRFREKDALQKYVRDEAPEQFGSAFIPVTVRDSAEIANSVLNKLPVCNYRPQNAVVQDFKDLTAELMKRLEAM